VGLAGLTSWLRDGDEVLFDGESGIVRKAPIDTVHANE